MVRSSKFAKTGSQDRSVGAVSGTRTLLLVPLSASEANVVVRAPVEVITTMQQQATSPWARSICPLLLPRLVRDRTLRRTSNLDLLSLLRTKSLSKTYVSSSSLTCTSILRSLTCRQKAALVHGYGRFVRLVRRDRNGRTCRSVERERTEQRDGRRSVRDDRRRYGRRRTAQQVRVREQGLDRRL